MHPRLAETLGVVDGDLVTVSSRRGDITLPANVVNTIRPDTVFIPYHWPGGKAANQLTAAGAVGSLTPRVLLKHAMGAEAAAVGTTISGTASTTTVLNVTSAATFKKGTFIAVQVGSEMEWAKVLDIDTGASPDTITSADIFVAIGDYISKNPDLVGSVNTVFQFQIKSPDAAYSVDVKNGKGGVTEGTAPADVTLELSDADFLAMSSGAVDPQKLYFSGKLKISGNVMASQKLMFLKKVDPAQAKDAVMAARKAKGGSAPAAAPAPATPAAAASPAPPCSITRSWG